MLVTQTFTANSSGSPRQPFFFTLSLFGRKSTEIRFTIVDGQQPRRYRIHLPLAQMRKMHLVKSPTHDQLIFSLDCPPRVYLRANDIASTHADYKMEWKEEQAWSRQTEILATFVDLGT